MPAKPAFRNDKLEILVRKCIVFPADGSETRLEPMIARTVTVDDISGIRLYNRCVDMTSTFGDCYRKTQVTHYQTTEDGGIGNGVLPRRGHVISRLVIE